MRQEHEPGDDEHLANVLIAINSANKSDGESANYTEIFNHIAQEINFVGRSMSNSGQSWNLEYIIFILLTIK